MLKISTNDEMMVIGLAEILADEMIERNWTSRDVAGRMGPRIGPHRDFRIDCLSFEMLLCAPHDLNTNIEDDQYADLSKAFGVSVEFLKNIHNQWNHTPINRRKKFDCPDYLLSNGA